MKKRALTLLVVALLCVGLVFTLGSCMDEEDYYTKDNIAELTAQLEAELNAKINASNADIAALKADYEAKIADLEAQDEQNRSAIESLTSTYNNKVAGLEAADAANASALAALRSEYETKVTELNGKIAANAAKIEEYKSAMQSGIDRLKKQVDSDVAEINELIAAVKSAQSESAAKIAELEKQVAAIMNVPKYTVTFDLNGGNETIPAQTIYEGKKITAPAEPTREGHVFLGWYVGEEKWSFVGYTVTEDVTLKARWVSTDIIPADGAILESETLTLRVAFPVEYIDLTDFFTYDEACTVRLYADLSLETEYAYCRMTGITEGANRAYMLVKYSDRMYTLYDVVIHAIGHVSFDSEGSTYETVAVAGDLTVDAPQQCPTSTRPGYEFAYWAVDGVRAIFPCAVDETTTFTAVYTPVVYSIIYSVGDGSMPEDYQTTYTVESSVSLPTPTRSLYMFGGWYESADFSGSPVASIAIGTYGAKTYYAKWLSATHGITYSLSGGGAYYTVTGVETGVTEVVIPDTVEGKPVRAIANYAFKDKQRIISIAIPDSVITIGSEAFGGCISLTTLALGKGVTSIPGSMAYNCNKLTEITIPDSVTSIGNSAFEDCSSLTSITIPDSVTSIGYSAFSGCSSLTSITIPDGLTSIGSSAFKYCSSLTSITIPDSVTSIGEEAFRGCGLMLIHNNSDLSFEFGSTSNGNIAENAKIIVDHGTVTKVNDGSDYILTEDKFIFKYDGTNYTLIAYCGGEQTVTLPRDINGHEYNTSGIKGVKKVIIPDGVTDISSNMFKDCYGLESIVIPNSVIGIGSYAFDGCYGLESITIPNSVTTIGYSAFFGCNSLTGIYITDIAAWCNISFESYHANPLFYAHNLYLNSELVTELVIPDGVTSIGNEAFYNCSSLTSITIPDSVTSIGYGAFRGCSSLTSITIPDSVTSIGNRAFYNCTGLTKVCITDIAAWCNISFGGPYGDVEEYIYANPLSYAKNLYLNGELVAELVIPNNVESISSFAFYGCDIRSVTISYGVKEIGGRAFAGCCSLKSVTIGNSVTSIGYCAFYDCSSLKSVTFMNNTSGWRAGSIYISSDLLADAATAAKYLRETYCDYIWHRQ